MDKSSTDVWFIAFLMNKGFKIKSYTVLHNHKVKCFFDIKEEEWQKLKLEFNNSELVKFKGLIDQIKDLGY